MQVISHPLNMLCNSSATVFFWFCPKEVLIQHFFLGMWSLLLLKSQHKSHQFRMKSGKRDGLLKLKSLLLFRQAKCITQYKFWTQPFDCPFHSTAEHMLWPLPFIQIWKCPKDYAVLQSQKSSVGLKIRNLVKLNLLFPGVITSLSKRHSFSPSRLFKLTLSLIIQAQNFYISPEEINKNVDNSLSSENYSGHPTNHLMNVLLNFPEIRILCSFLRTYL